MLILRFCLDLGAFCRDQCISFGFSLSVGFCLHCDTLLFKLCSFGGFVIINTTLYDGLKRFHPVTGDD